MGWVVLMLFAANIAGLVGIYAALVNDMAKGLEEQRQDRLALEDRLRKKGIIE
jgi:sensor domain CHASE-containing protein